MSTTNDIITSVKKKDFVAAKEHFTKVVEAKMRQSLNQEFRAAGKALFAPVKKK